MICHKEGPDEIGRIPYDLRAHQRTTTMICHKEGPDGMGKMPYDLRGHQRTTMKIDL